MYSCQVCVERDRLLALPMCFVVFRDPPLRMPSPDFVAHKVIPSMWLETSKHHPSIQASQAKPSIDCSHVCSHRFRSALRPELAGPSATTGPPTMAATAAGAEAAFRASPPLPPPRIRSMRACL